MHDSVLQSLEALLLGASRNDLPVRQRLPLCQPPVRQIRLLNH
jgi:hypothetical protein